MPAVATHPDKPEWLSATDAAELLNVGRHHLARLAAEGLVSIRNLPGVRARFLRADVERLARESVSKAKAKSPRRRAEQ